jgi:hypothetical protein
MQNFFYTVAFFDYNKPLEVWFDNKAWFVKHGLAEKALLAAWQRQQDTYMWTPFVGMFLKTLDREKLRRCGDPLPEGDTYTLYRGVQGLAGGVKGTNPRGISWTTDRDVAERFAHRCPMLPRGAVYTVTVPREAVLAYLHLHRPEHEMLVVLDKKTEVKLAA